MADDVMCEVESCKYYKQGNVCTASSIKVINHSGHNAHSTGETDCETFEVRG